MFLYDAAYGPPDLTVWKQHGAIAGSHYMTGTYAQSSPQPAALRAAELGALLNWERMPGALVGAPRTSGQAVGREALAAVPAGCPRDGSVAIYFSVDVDVADNAWNSCDEAFRGVNDILGGQFRAAVYGEIGLINHLVAAGILHGKHWLSMSEGFSPRGTYAPASPNVCLVQMHDVGGNWIGTDLPGTDRNTVTDPHALGAWWPDGSPYAGGDDMPLTDADVAKIWSFPFSGIDTTGHRHGPYPASTWVANTNLGVAFDLKKQISDIAGMPLTDSQVQAIAQAVAGQMPASGGFVVQSTITPK